MKLNLLEYFNQETERLTFRELTKNDIESWKEFFEENDSLHFLGIDLSKTKDELAEGWINKQLERYQTQGLGHLAVIEKNSGEFIGMGGILPREIEEKVVFEIAYSLKPRFWRKGYGTEIAKQMKIFGNENKIANQFISIIDKNNLDSINVAKKNNMKVLYETEYLGMNVFIFGTEAI
jgi:ribosomal-protein-alanine N-acetyltransferase